jgi:hypothetical protein
MNIPNQNKVSALKKHYGTSPEQLGSEIGGSWKMMDIIISLRGTGLRRFL